MALRRLSGECDFDDVACHGVWEDDEGFEELVMVGDVIDPASAPPLGPGEGAIRIRRRVVRDARIV